MIIRAFELVGYYLALIFYYTLTIPLIFMALFCCVFSIAMLGTRNREVMIRHRGWRSATFRWCARLKWPNSYLEIISKFTGYYP